MGSLLGRGGGQRMGLPYSSPQKLQFLEHQQGPSPDPLWYVSLDALDAGQAASW